MAEASKKSSDLPQPVLKHPTDFTGREDGGVILYLTETELEASREAGVGRRCTRTGAPPRRPLPDVVHDGRLWASDPRVSLRAAGRGLALRASQW
jgi:hypothetical protein